jgi:ubiquinone/menaquinone biosynthesis C-methylase UbiE
MNDLNLFAIKQKQQAAWASGDYGKIGVTLQITGEQLCEFINIQSGQKVLDVAAGNGNATLAAARRFCHVTSTDYVSVLLEQGRQRSVANGLPITFLEADAEALPFKDNQFDAVLSTFGVMFTPNQSQAARELVRVCRPGGKIGLANWTPDGFIGQLFKLIGGFIPPAKGVSSPSNWGTEAFIQSQFANVASQIELRKRSFNFRYQSPEHWLDLFRDYYGPIHKAFLSLDSVKAKTLETEILGLIERFNTADDSTMLVASEYLEISITI